MLIAPTEPPSLRAIGKVSLAPEQHGADIMMASKNGLIGIQRKAIPDLVASVHDGRLDKELSQMKLLDIGVLIIEGRETWSSDGLMLGLHTRFTKAQYLGVQLSAQMKGAWLLRTSSLQETISSVLMLEKWAQTDRSVTSRRTGPSSPWGTAGNRDWLIHLVQGIEGVGSKHGKDIVDKFGCPFVWKEEVNTTTLQLIEGIGPKKAEKIYNALLDSNSER